MSEHVVLIEHLALPIFHTFTSFRGQVLASFQDESSNFQFPASAFCGRCGIFRLVFPTVREDIEKENR